MLAAGPVLTIESWLKEKRVVISKMKVVNSNQKKGNKAIISNHTSMIW